MPRTARPPALASAGAPAAPAGAPSPDVAPLGTEMDPRDGLPVSPSEHPTNGINASNPAASAAPRRADLILIVSISLRNRDNSVWWPDSPRRWSIRLGPHVERYVAGFDITVRKRPLHRPRDRRGRPTAGAVVLYSESIRPMRRVCGAHATRPSARRPVRCMRGQPVVPVGHVPA
jgi:hypothetical protein